MPSSKCHRSLDHVRGFAAFVVFSWHYLSFQGGEYKEPLNFFLSIFTEGHTGVAIFMTLSGYLFAKLLDGRDYSFPKFFFNRIVRLFPLLLAVFLTKTASAFFTGTADWDWFRPLLFGFVLPTWPNGGWSIAVELHFYLAMAMSKRARSYAPLLLLLPMAVRLVIYLIEGEVQSLAYWTIIGRVDQFLIGILMYQYRHVFTDRHVVAAVVAAAFLGIWYWFDTLGGFYKAPSYPSPNPVWIVLTTIEGFAYGALICWYDNSFQHEPSRASRFFEAVGTYSYSIYLLHFFIVFRIPPLIHEHLFDLSNRYLLFATVIPSFLVMVGIAAVSYHVIEKPFLRFRIRYLKDQA